MLRLITLIFSYLVIFLNLNTSHVKVNRIAKSLTKKLKLYLNTSHVKVNPVGTGQVSIKVSYLNTSHVKVNHI